MQITVSAQTGERMQSREVAFAIPRHGYAVESLAVQPGHLTVGGSAELRLELNAPVPSAVTAVLSVRPALAEDGGAEERLELVLAPGQSTGSLSVSPVRAGAYELELVSALFADPGAGTDQRGAAGVGVSTILRAWDPAGLTLSLDKLYLREGDTAILTVGLAQLPSRQPVRVQLEVIRPGGT